MPNEIELKFKVSSLPAVRKTLAAFSAEDLGSVLQSDHYFDTPDGSLLKRDSGVRIRVTEPLRSSRHPAVMLPGIRRGEAPEVAPSPHPLPQGRGVQLDRPLLTYKGPANLRRKAKIRMELQTCVDDFETMAKILSALGLQARLVIQKRRHSYRLGPCLVELDELPVLGCFVEIEGPSVRAIQAVRRRLGLEVEPLKSHYIGLVTAACGRANHTCMEITFGNCHDSCQHFRRAKGKRK